MAKRKSGNRSEQPAADAAADLAANDVDERDEATVVEDGGEAVPEAVNTSDEITAELSGDEDPDGPRPSPQPEEDGTARGEMTVADDRPDAEVIDLAEARALAPDVVLDEGAGGEVGAGQLSMGIEGEAAADDETVGPVAFEQLEPLIESLLFASDKPLSLGDLKRLTGERDSRLINEALQALMARRADTGVILVSVGGGHCLRTNPAFAGWVGKLLAAKPVRLSRAMLETLAIIAYRQPITRPEMDDIRGVDCGPVLKTLLDRGLIRIIGKKEEVGRPMLYGTTPEFLRIFSLKDLTELPTLRQFHELSAEHQAKVAAKHGEEAAAAVSAETAAASAEGVGMGVGQGLGVGPGNDPQVPIARSSIAPDPDEDDGLLSDLEEASAVAARAAAPLHPPQENAPGEGTPPPGPSE